VELVSAIITRMVYSSTETWSLIPSAAHVFCPALCHTLLRSYWTHRSVFLSIHPSSIFLSIIYLSFYLTTHPPIKPPTHLRTCQFVWPNQPPNHLLFNKSLTSFWNISWKSVSVSCQVGAVNYGYEPKQNSHSIYYKATNIKWCNRYPPIRDEQFWRQNTRSREYTWAVGPRIHFLQLTHQTIHMALASCQPVNWRLCGTHCSQFTKWLAKPWLSYFFAHQRTSWSV